MKVSAGSAMRQIAGMSLRRARRGRMIWVSVSLLGLLVLWALAASLGDKGGLEAFKQVTDVLLRFIAPIIMVLHGSGAVSEEVQAKTISYLFSRPIPRWTLPMGKLMASLGIGFVLLVPGVVLIYLASMVGYMELFTYELNWLLRALAAVALAVLLYGAIATAFGTMVSKHSFVAALIYFLLMEVGFAFIPGRVKVIAMTTHLRVVAGLYEPQTSMFMSDPELSAGLAVPVLSAVILLWIFITATWVGTSEYRTDQ